MTNEQLSFFRVNGQILQSLLDIALSKGGEYADLFFEYDILNQLQIRDHMVNSVGSHIDYGVGIRVIKGEQTGYAYSESTEIKEMEDAARTAAAIADKDLITTRPIEIRTIKGGNFYPVNIPWQEVTIDKKKKYLNTLDETIFKKNSKIQKVIAQISDQYSKTLFINSLGEYAYDEGPMASVAATAIMSDGKGFERVSSSRSFRMGGEMLTKSLAEEIADEISERGDLLFGAGRIEGGEMPVVMAAGGSGILLHEAIGHAFEADFNRKKTSIFCDKLGKTICNSQINIVDDGTVRFNRGSINYDDEGVPGQKTYLVKEGILNSYLHDRISARHYGVSPTGNGRRESFRFDPIPRMRATYMENGDLTEEELISRVKKGVYALNFTNGEVKIGEGDFTFYVKNGYLIENGKLTKRIKDFNVIGNGPEALADITAVANNLKIDNGTWICGKGQLCPVSCGTPSFLVKRLTVGGVE